MIDEETGIIKAPVSIRDLQEVFGVEYTDIRSIIENANINMWARYKPVCLPLKKPLDELKSDNMHWNEAPQEASWQLTPASAWFYGCVYMPVYTIRTISDYTDIGSNDVANENFKWQYNKPKGNSAVQAGYFFRLTDFAGYNHDIRNRVNIAMTRTEFVTPATLFAVSLNINDDDYSSKEYCGWAGGDIFKLIHHYSPNTLHLGVYVRYRRGSVWVEECFVHKSTIPASDGTDPQDISDVSQTIAIAIGQRSDFASLGLSAGDKVEFYAFITAVDISQLQSVTDYVCRATFGSLSKYSAYMDSNCIVHRSLDVRPTGSDPSEIRYKTIIFTQSLQISITSTAASRYVWYDDSLYEVDMFIDSVNGNVIFNGSNTGQVERGNLFGSGYVDSVDDAGDVPCIPSTTWIINRALSYGLTIHVNGNLGSTYTYYNSEADARSETGGIDTVGIPIFKRCIENYQEANRVGLITNRSVRVGFSGSTTEAYTRLIFSSENDLVSNI